MNFHGTQNETSIPDAKACPSGSGTERLFSVEARYNYHEPKVIAGQMFDNRWKRIPYSDAPHGIPKPRYISQGRSASNLLTRQEAEAIRWWFICIAEASENVGGSLCLETRIVEHEVEYSYSVTPKRYIDAFDMRGNIPDDMKPDEDSPSPPTPE